MNSRHEKVTPFYVMDIAKEAAKYEDAIHFEIGQPDISPSPKVAKAVKAAVDDEHFGYTDSRGLEALREKIASHYKVQYGVVISADQIFITPGTSGAFMVAYMLTLESDGRLALSDPSYPCYKNFAYLLALQPEFIPVSQKSDFKITPEALSNVDADAVQISSPSNPVGNLYTAEELMALLQYCSSRDVTLISDELYHGLVYDGKAHTALEFSENAIVINGFSKYYCMPGMRIGWMIVPPGWIKTAEAIVQNLFISAPTLSQYAALEAFDASYLKKVQATFKERRDYLYGELKEIFDIPVKPEGAFYIWADISRYSSNSFAFAREVLENAHIAVTPGFDFGSNQTDHFIRFAYARDMEHLQEGVQRLKEYLKRRY